MCGQVGGWEGVKTRGFVRPVRSQEKKGLFVPIQFLSLWQMRMCLSVFCDAKLQFRADAMSLVLPPLYE